VTETRVGVVGAGLMGRGIAQVAAVAGHEVLVHDAAPAQWDAALTAIGASLERFVAKGTLDTATRDAALARLRFVPELSAFADREVVIEAIVEDLEAKRELWQRLEATCTPSCLFATNTSSLAVVDQAAGLAHPGRLVGLHFFNPVPRMQLVEVVRSIETSEATVAAATAFVTGLGKVPVTTRDESGFLVNLLLVPYLLDAVRALERGVGDTAAIDTGMTLGAGHPMGPLTLLDFVGLDTVVRIAEIMFDQYREPRYAPPPLLRRMVSAGRLGRKNQLGFYDWRGEHPVPLELGL
jgi:3-hydroxybutyryl-CoA dehydrogenase